MGVKSIKDWEAQRIAEKIANKAFAHIYKGFDEKEAVIAERCYEVAVAPFLHLKNELKEANLITLRHSVHIDVEDGKGNTHTVHYGQVFDDDIVRDDDRDDNGDLICPSGWSQHLVLRNADLYDAITSFYSDRSPYDKKKAELTDTLARQLRNKSLAATKKAWPEAAGILDAHFGLQNGPPMTIPLEQLLAKFLLALPAPQVV